MESYTQKGVPTGSQLSLFRESDTDSGLPVVRANHSAKQGNVKAVTMNEPYSRKYLELFRKSDRNGLFWRTFTDLLLSTTGTISNRRLPHCWRILVTRYNRILFQLRPLARGTDETEFGLCAKEMMLRTPDANMNRGKRTSENLTGRIKNGMPLNLNDQLDAMSYGLLPTATARDYRSAKRVNSSSPYSMLNETIALLPTPTSGRPTQEMSQSQMDRNSLNLAQTIQLLPTPDTSDRRSMNSKQQGLSNVVKMLPTPNARDWKGEAGNQPVLPDLIEGRARDGVKTGMKLQPGFVEWMMGFPLNWTDLSCQNQSTEKND